MGTKVIQVEGKPVEVPDDITDDELSALLNGSAPTRNYAASEVPGAMLRNAPESAGRVAKGVVESALHPVDTIKQMLGLAGLPVTLPAWAIASGIEDLGVPNVGKKFREEYIQPQLDFGQNLINRWGGYENVKRTMAEDPAGAVMDVLGLTPAGPKLAKTAPVRVTGRAIEKAGSSVGNLIKQLPVGAVDALIQSHEGIGSGAIRDVVRAGEEGKSVVRKSISEGINYDDVLSRIRDAVTSLGEKRALEYNNLMKVFKGADAPVHFGKIDQAIARADEMGQYRGKSGLAKPIDKRSPAEIKARDEINGIIDEWRNGDPAEFHTTYGFDQMKQKLNKFVDSIPDVDSMKGPATAYANKIMSAVRDTIREKAPKEYVDAMEAYGQKSDQMREFIKEFKLRDSNTDIQTLRSLQQVHRRTANVAHGEKERLLRDALDAAGEKDLMQILAGGQFNPIIPQGMRGTMVPLMTAAVLGGAINPIGLAATVAASPRMTGIAGYNFGRARGAMRRAAPNFNPLGNTYDYLKWNADPTLQAITSEAPEQKARGGALSRLAR